jgi:hypothetical protein
MSWNPFRSHGSTIVGLAESFFFEWSMVLVGPCPTVKPESRSEVVPSVFSSLGWTIPFTIFAGFMHTASILCLSIRSMIRSFGAHDSSATISLLSRAVFL